MRRLLPLGTLLVLLTAFALALAACGDDERPTSAQPTAEPTASADKFPLAVPRSDGRQLTIPEVPQRIASLSPGGGGGL